MTGLNGNRAVTLLDRPAPHRRRAVMATGFDPLDEVLGGGLRPGDLTVVGGRPGVGKTVVTLQWARWAAAGGRDVVYVSYEHEARSLLARLLLMEVRELANGDPLPPIEVLRDLADEIAMGQSADAADSPVVRRGLARLRSYADRLALVQGSLVDTDLDRLSGFLGDGEDGALFIDYLQKVPVRSGVAADAERVGHVVAALKDLALSREVVVVAVASTDGAGLTAPRARLHHVRGSEAIAYEADVAVMLNEKATAVSHAHRAFDPVRAREFRDVVVMSLEKNRRGEGGMNLEFHKDFAYWRLDPRGGFVAERLVDDLTGDV